MSPSSPSDITNTQIKVTLHCPSLSKSIPNTTITPSRGYAYCTWYIAALLSCPKEVFVYNNTSGAAIEDFSTVKKGPFKGSAQSSYGPLSYLFVYQGNGCSACWGWCSMSYCKCSRRPRHCSLKKYARTFRRRCANRSFIPRARSGSRHYSC